MYLSFYKGEGGGWEIENIIKKYLNRELCDMSIRKRTAIQAIDEMPLMHP